MRIVHISVTGAYTEGMAYQDNMLTQYNLEDGHDVTMIANCAIFQEGKRIQSVPCDKILSNGLRLIRMPYDHIFNSFVSDKLRKVTGLYELLESISPDVIMSHSLCYWSVLDVIRYKRNHPEVKLYTDTHTAENNSGTNWVSMHILHRFFYRMLTHRALPYIEKFFYISDECREFAAKHYGVPEEMMEFYPLGGQIFLETEYHAYRQERRAELDVEENEILLVHSGKMNDLKRTDDLLRAFAAVPQLRAKLAIIGSIPEDRKELLESLIAADSRVRYLGWRGADELQEYLCACDLYCQPGSQSATMQNAVCCNCAILLYPHGSYRANFDYGNILWVDTEKDIADTFQKLAEGKISLESLIDNSARCARELLDYHALAAKICK